METSHSPNRRLIAVFILGLVVLGGLLFALDWEEIIRVIRAADWRPVPTALLFTTISYVCVGYSFAKVSRLLGIRMAERELAEIGFITIVLNHVLTTGGVFGYSLRYLLMSRRGVKMRNIVASSLLHFYLTSLVILLMLPVSFVYLLLNSPVGEGVALALGLITALLVLLALLGTVLIFKQSLRRAVLEAMGRLTRFVSRREFGVQIEQFDAAMTRAVAVMRERPRLLTFIVAVIAVDWVTAVIVLDRCFAALGNQVGFGVLTTGFVIGIIAGVLSMLPGGIGVQEASMAGIFALLGVSFERALLAAILFRGVYYLIPYIVSLGIYVRLIRIPEPELPKSARRVGTPRTHPDDQGV